MRSRLWLVLLLVFLLNMPAIAYAEERANDERFRENEELVLRAGPPTPFSKIQEFFYNTKVFIRTGSYRLSNLNGFIVRMFLDTTWIYAIQAAVALLFLWWGVRKVIRILFRAFRKGKINA